MTNPKPKLWYAARPYGDNWDMWTCGPYPTPEDAIGALIRKRGLQLGEWVAVGYLVPHKPKLDADVLIAALRANEDVEISHPEWLDDVPTYQADMLEAAVQAAILEWLDATEQLPEFGTIEGIQEYQLGVGRFEYVGSV